MVDLYILSPDLVLFDSEPMIGRSVNSKKSAALNFQVGLVCVKVVWASPKCTLTVGKHLINTKDLREKKYLSGKKCNSPEPLFDVRTHSIENPPGSINPNLPFWCLFFKTHSIEKPTWKRKVLEPLWHWRRQPNQVCRAGNCAFDDWCIVRTSGW